MPPPANNHILLTGATGYIGGTVLDSLVKSQEPSLKSITFDTPVRRQDQAEKLRDVYGSRVNPILWNGPDDAAWMADTAANYDLILNAGLAFHANGGKPFVDGLARRLKNGSGKPEEAPWILHVGGCTNVSDRPLTQEAFPDRVWDDADPGAVYEFIKSEDAKDPYVQRTNEVNTLAAAEETGVQALSLNTPLIFGEGKGQFNTSGLIIPINLDFVVKHGYAFKLNETANMDWVHVEDLADLWVLVVRTILERPDRGVGYIPSGAKGIIFPSVGRVLCSEIMQRCLDAAFDAGVLPREGTPKEKEIRQVTLEEVAADVTAGDIAVLEKGWAGHKGMTGTMAKKLFGWNPKRLQEDWEKAFAYELKQMQGGKRGALGTVKSAIGMK